MMQYEGSLEFVLYIMIMYYDLIPTPREFVLYIMIMHYDLIPTPCEFVLYKMIMCYDLIPTPCEFVLYIMIMYSDLIPTPCAPKWSVGCLSSPLWNPRSVIWSHCSISYLAVLPNPVAHFCPVIVLLMVHFLTFSPQILRTSSLLLLLLLLLH